jgi:gas vesicle protein
MKETAMMTQKDWTEITLSLLSGAGIGAAVMYLLDPESGHDRREYLARRAGDAWEGAEEHMHHLGETAGGAISGLSKQVGKQTHYLSKRARHMGEDVADYGRRAGRWTYAKASRQPDNEWEVSGTTTLLAAVGALTLGAGLMYLLDPASGRRRRAVIRDKAVHYANEAQDTVTSKGRDLRNRAVGTYHEARKMVGGQQSQERTNLSSGTSGSTCADIPPATTI